MIHDSHMPTATIAAIDAGERITRRRAIVAVRHCASFAETFAWAGLTKVAQGYALDAMRIAQHVARAGRVAAVSGPTTLTEAARQAAELLTGAPDEDVAAALAARLVKLADEQDRVFAELATLNATSMQALGSEGEGDALCALWEAVETLTDGAK
jgi:hypothetical protein